MYRDENFRLKEAPHFMEQSRKAGQIMRDQGMVDVMTALAMENITGRPTQETIQEIESRRREKMNVDEDFPRFPSIPRLDRGIIITEKIDGTNGVIEVRENLPSYYIDIPLLPGEMEVVLYNKVYVVRAGSRNRWLTTNKGEDNFDFARFVADRAYDIVKYLGVGLHRGEYFGRGIARGYGLDHRRFALFNTERWGQALLPPHFTTVPVLTDVNYFDTLLVDFALGDLRRHGSNAVPGFMSPEGVVVLHKQSGYLFKKTIGDDGHKGERK